MSGRLVLFGWASLLAMHLKSRSEKPPNEELTADSVCLLQSPAILNLMCAVYQHVG